jgi:predicted metal-dependent phosphoesterase TrpH
MENRRVDLHVHTSYSDGAFSPEEAVRFARAQGLAAISITDHDTVEGIPFALEEGRKQGVEVIPGVELSAELRDIHTTEMHILGYYINWESAQFRESMELFRKARRQRADQILEKLSKLGVHLDREHLFSIAGHGAIGRLHFAKALVEEGFANGIPDCFQKFLGIGKPAYVPKLRLKPEEAIGMILKIGGIPVLAHPYYGHYNNRNLLRGLVNAGLKGIEVWHSKHPPQTVQLFEGIARELHLLSTGGSDCHGAFGNDPASMGKVNISYNVVTELKKYKETVEKCAGDIFDQREPQ